jgi:hypothetical protein
MAYSIEIARTLTDQLTKFATLNRHQLVGHVANLDFWLAEVRHCLDVLDGYQARFRRLQVSHKKHVSEHETIEFDLHDPCCTVTTASPPNRVPDRELKEARHLLCEATYRFLIRCFHEGFLEESKLREACENLGIGVETSDLKRRKVKNQRTR